MQTYRALDPKALPLPSPHKSEKFFYFAASVKAKGLPAVTGPKDFGFISFPQSEETSAQKLNASLWTNPAHSMAIQSLQYNLIQFKAIK